MWAESTTCDFHSDRQECGNISFMKEHFRRKSVSMRHNRVLARFKKYSKLGIHFESESPHFPLPRPLIFCVSLKKCKRSLSKFAIRSDLKFRGGLKEQAGMFRSN
jgi:hypothetical protein